MDRHSTPGFSLPELLIALAIVAILATITIPSYSGLAAKARRSDAMVALLQIQLEQERWRADHAQYAKTLQALGWSTPVSPDGYYRLRIERAGTSGYLAIAQPTGVQASDVCQSFAVNASGPFYEQGYADPRCWKR